METGHLSLSQTRENNSDIGKSTLTGSTGWLSWSAENFFTRHCGHKRGIAFLAEKRATVTPWVGQGLSIMAGASSQHFLHCPSQEQGSQEGARGSHSPGHWPSPRGWWWGRWDPWLAWQDRAERSWRQTFHTAAVAQTGLKWTGWWEGRVGQSGSLVLSKSWEFFLQGVKFPSWARAIC